MTEARCPLGDDFLYVLKFYRPIIFLLDIYFANNPGSKSDIPGLKVHFTIVLRVRTATTLK